MCMLSQQNLQGVLADELDRKHLIASAQAAAHPQLFRPISSSSAQPRYPVCLERPEELLPCLPYLPTLHSGFERVYSQGLAACVCAGCGALLGSGLLAVWHVYLAMALLQLVSRLEDP